MTRLLVATRPAQRVGRGTPCGELRVKRGMLSLLCEESMPPGVSFILEWDLPTHGGLFAARNITRGDALILLAPCCVSKIQGRILMSPGIVLPGSV